MGRNFGRSARIRPYAPIPADAPVRARQGILLDFADVGVGLEIVLVAEAFEEEERQDVGLVVLAGGLAAQDVRGAPEPGFEFLLRQHPPEMIPERRERKAKDVGRKPGRLPDRPNCRIRCTELRPGLAVA